MTDKTIQNIKSWAKVSMVVVLMCGMGYIAKHQPDNRQKKQRFDAVQRLRDQHRAIMHVLDSITANYELEASKLNNKILMNVGAAQKDADDHHKNLHDAYDSLRALNNGHTQRIDSIQNIITQIQAQADSIAQVYGIKRSDVIR